MSDFLGANRVDLKYSDIFLLHAIKSGFFCLIMINLHSRPHILKYIPLHHLPKFHLFLKTCADDLDANKPKDAQNEEPLYAALSLTAIFV